jgi:nucleotide-binding universal stress UspA family protein
MLKRILVATDGSDHARKATSQASDLASKYKARLYLVHVVSFAHTLSMSPRLAGEGGIQSLMNHVKRAGDMILREAEAEARGKGVPMIQTFLAEGDPTSEILRLAKAYDVDMIVLGSHGAGRLEASMLGSVSYRVCNMAECICVTVK